MSQPSFERARSSEQKQLREAAIIEAAERLFETQDFDQMSLSDIAREANFTRSNVYKYFARKEDIFLSIVGRELQTVAEQLTEALKAHAQSDIANWAKLWARNIAQNKKFLRLLGIVFSHLEKNVGYDSFVRYKALIYGTMQTLAQTLRLYFPGASLQSLEDFIYLQFATGAGLYPMTLMTPVKKRLQKEGLYQAVHFESLFAQAVESFMRRL